jgi:hypothetical protein
VKELAMDLSMDRRRLLTAAVLGSTGAIVGATALGSLAPEAAFAAEGTKVAPGAPDADFAEGLVTGIDGTMLSVAGSNGTRWLIRVTYGSSVWKLHPTTFDQIKVGDGLYARGVRMPDGTLAADAVWVNIVNLQVHVVSVARNTLHLDHRGQRVVGRVLPGTSAAVYNDTPPVADLSLLKAGSHVQVLGAWIPGTNEIDIATVYAAV